MTKVLIGVAIALISAYAYAQGVGLGPTGRYQIVSGAGPSAWKIDTATGSVWHCYSSAQNTNCNLAK